MRNKGHAYEVYTSPIIPDWRWEILKKWQAPENEAKNPYARWFCDVYTPIVPDGEIGDTYVNEILQDAKAQLVSTHAECPNCFKRYITIKT